jgi:hypothetical protein
VAVTTAVCPADTLPAVAVNVAVLEPAGTMTAAGTASAARLLESVTVAPPVATGCDIVTVHVAVPPGVRVDGVHVTEVRDGVAAGEPDDGSSVRKVFVVPVL